MASAQISPKNVGHPQKCAIKAGRKEAAALKGTAPKRRASRQAENALQREQRRAVLEQLRTMVGCDEGCGQFEIVQRVIHYIGQLNVQLQQDEALGPCEVDQQQTGGAAQALPQGQLSAALGQLIASLSLICRRKAKSAKAGQQLNRAQQKSR